MKAHVYVTLKASVLDPQGQTIRRALTQMGYDWVRKVRTGRTFEVEIEAEDLLTARGRLEEISSKLLANPVIEESTIEVEPLG